MCLTSGAADIPGERALHLFSHDRNLCVETFSDLCTHNRRVIRSESDSIAHRPLDLLLLRFRGWQSVKESWPRSKEQLTSSAASSMFRTSSPTRMYSATCSRDVMITYSPWSVAMRNGLFLNLSIPFVRIPTGSRIKRTAAIHEEMNGTGG